MAKSKRKKSPGSGRILYGLGCGCGVGLLLVLLVGGASFYWFYWRNLAPSRPDSQGGAVARELDRTEPDWTFDATVARWRDAKIDKNGADLVLDVDKLLVSGWDRGMEPAHQERMSAFGRLPNLAPDARAMLGRNKSAVWKAKELAFYSQARFSVKIDTNPLATKVDHLNKVRRTVAFLRVIAAREVMDDHPEEAVDCARAMLNLSRYAKEEPFTISQIMYVALSSMAAETLEDCLRHQQAKEPPDGALASFQAALLEEGDDLRMRYTLHCERATMYHTLDALRTKKLSLADIGKDENLQVTPEMSRLAIEQADYGQFLLLTNLNEAIEIAKLPAHEQRARYVQWEDGVRRKTDEVRASEKKDGVTGLLLLPKLTKLYAAQMRRCALLRTAGLALAIERYRRDHQNWPADLTKLVPKYLSRIPLDPYTGTPLTYQFYQEGVAILSVGAQNRQPPRAFDILEQRGADTIQSFRLWHRNLRRSPVQVK